MAEESTSGALSWLDGLGSAFADFSNAAVSTAENVAAVKATLKGPSSGDQTPVGAVSRLQSAVSSVPVLWIGGGLVLVVVAVLLLRRK